MAPRSVAARKRSKELQEIEKAQEGCSRALVEGITFGQIGGFVPKAARDEARAREHLFQRLGRAVGEIRALFEESSQRGDTRTVVVHTL